MSDYYPTINRTLVMVIPKQPYFDWGNAIFPDLPPASPSDEGEYSSYLIPEDLFNGFGKAAKKKALSAYWEEIFEEELFGVCTNPDKWPKISWTLFEAWFDCHFSTLVKDIAEEPLFTEHFE